MSTPTERRTRRPGTLAAAGAVALTAAVALPAFTLARTDDAVGISADTPAESRVAELVAQPAVDQRDTAVDAYVAAATAAEDLRVYLETLGGLPADQQFAFSVSLMPEAERTQLVGYLSAIEEAQRRAAEEAEAARRAEEARRAEQARQQARSSAAAPSVSGGSVWDTIAQCESSGNWSMNSGNGFYGGLQFTLQSWQYVGGTQYAAYPHQASRAQQIAAAERLRARQGWGAWPACSARAGLR